MQEMVSALVAGRTVASFNERMSLQREVIAAVAAKLFDGDALAACQAVAPVFATMVPPVRK